MPVTARAMAITDHYRREQRQRRADLVARLARLWAAVNLDALPDSFAAWQAAAVAQLTAAQQAEAIAAEAYLAAFLAAELGRPSAAPPSIAAELAGRTQDGRPLELLLAGALIGVRLALKQNQPAARALQIGRARGLRSAAVEAAAAGRVALDHGMSQRSSIVGWRRVAATSACGACLGAATGAIQRDDRLLETHAFCDCSKEAVVRGVRERALRPTGVQIFNAKTTAEQDAMFAGRGGAEKAELIRSGQISLEDLVHRQAMALVPDGLTEAPLSALRA